MYIVLLSGGSGKRLWPLSNEIRSKQFLKLFKNDSGIRESMVQRVYKQIKRVDPNGKIIIATSKSQISSLHNQIGLDISVSSEPCRKDTFPAIALATSYLYEKEKVNEEEPVIICPVDPYVDDEYFKLLKKMENRIKTSDTNLVLMGINPLNPSNKYGYILPETNDTFSKIKSFKEKPDEPLAKKYIEEGGLWNGGVFAFKIKYLLEISKKLLGFNSYDNLIENYNSLPKISFDYAVVEKEKQIEVVRYYGIWKDLGSWNSLTETMSENIIGDAFLDEKSKGISIINELDVPILAMGLNNVVISASPDGILVAGKHEADNIKDYVEKLNRSVKFAEKSWGCFKVIDTGSDSLTIKVTITAGDCMNYHSHDFRDEVWVITKGEGIALVDEMDVPVKAGDVVTMTAGCKHKISALTDLEMIEVQLGKNINVQDKHKYE